MDIQSLFPRNWGPVRQMKINKYVHTGALWIPVFFCHPASPSSSRHLMNLIQALISDLPLCWQPKWIPARWTAVGQVLCLSAAVQTSKLKLGLHQWDFLCSAIGLFIFYWTEWGDAVYDEVLSLLCSAENASADYIGFSFRILDGQKRGALYQTPIGLDREQPPIES